MLSKIFQHLAHFLPLAFLTIIDSFSDNFFSAFEVIKYSAKFKLFNNKKSWLQWRYHPYETDGSGSQASLIYFIGLTDDLFINGFADINFIEDGEDRWLLEPQLNYVLTDLIDATIEFRYNEFEDANLKITLVIIY